MEEEGNPPADTARAAPQEPAPPIELAQRVTEAQGERALKALIGSGAAEFPMDVQMASMEPAGGEPPPQPPPPPPPSTSTED